MRECWAKALGDCSGGLTREHVFTRGLFDKKVVPAFGLPFLEGGAGDISIDAVTVKALCKTHNSGFSELDDAVIDFGLALKEFGRLMRVRADANGRHKKPVKWPSVTLPVDGLRLERWCMKTTVNMWLARHQDLTSWSAPANIVEAIGGRSALPADVGLGVVYDHQMPNAVQLDGSIAFAPLKRTSDGEVGAGLFHFAGMLLVCSWEHPLSSLMPLRSEGLTGNAMWHLENFREGPLNVGLRFDWTGKRAGPLIDRLRRERIPLAR